MFLPFISSPTPKSLSPRKLPRSWRRYYSSPVPENDSGFSGGEDRVIAVLRDPLMSFVPPSHSTATTAYEEPLGGKLENCRDVLNEVGCPKEYHRRAGICRFLTHPYFALTFSYTWISRLSNACPPLLCLSAQLAGRLCPRPCTLGGSSENT